MYGVVAKAQCKHADDSRETRAFPIGYEPNRNAGGVHANVGSSPLRPSDNCSMELAGWTYNDIALGRRQLKLLGESIILSNAH